MKILIVNLDKGIFEPNSASLERLKEYTGFCDKLSVIVLTRKHFKPIIFGKLGIFATASNSRLTYTRDALKLVREIIKKEKHDLVITQDPADTGHIGWLIKRKYKLPWQCQIHGDLFSSYYWKESFSNKIRVLVSKFLLPQADGIRVVSERIKKSLSKIKLNCNPVILPIFIDVEKFKSAELKINLKQKYPQFGSIILMASRISQEKNIDLAIKSMTYIIKNNPKTGLIIVGEGKEKNNLKDLVRNFNLYSNIIFEPWSSDLASYYKTSDIFLLTSNYEGWGMTVIEAAACGCPIIMTDVGCAGEFIKNKENGLIIKVDDRKSLVEAIKKFLNNKDLAKKLGEKAKQSVNTLPNHEKYLEFYKKSLADIINRIS
ncbi:MAG: glycosyltransferase family 4 protein [Candidatus Zambryskibacteria bacterium]|nr:glycosyltransferase family 4 protein [Candidatus Zambryskibacteria bacterium]